MRGACILRLALDGLLVRFDHVPDVESAAAQRAFDMQLLRIRLRDRKTVQVDNHRSTASGTHYKVRIHDSSSTDSKERATMDTQSPECFILIMFSPANAPTSDAIDL